MTTRRDLLRSTIPAAAFAAVGGGSFGSAFAAPEDGHEMLMARVMPELNFDGVPFIDVMEFFRTTTQANFDVRWGVIGAAGVDKNFPITLRLRNVKFSKVLDMVLSQAGAGIAPMSYVVDGGVISVSTKADLAQMSAAAPATAAGYFTPSNFFADGQWKLPKLPYAYDALEPHIDAKTMEIHHSRHHQAYVTNLNKAIKQMKELPDDVTPQTVEALQRDISFNMGGHALHSIFWGIIGPGAEGTKMGGEPTGMLLEAINAQFSSFEKFKKYFTTIATTVKGSGWAILGASPVSRSLVTYAIKDQDSTHPAGVLPILAVDVWEHAYYLKYQNERAAYVKAWWETINWTSVAMLMGT